MLDQQNAQTCSLDTYIIIPYNIPTHFDSKGTIISKWNQSNTA